MSAARRLQGFTILVVLAGVLAASFLPAAPAPTAVPVQPVKAVTLTVADAARAAEFYSRVLFFEKTSDLERQGPGAPLRVVRMRLGDETIELVQDPAAGPVAQPVAIVVNDMEQAYLWLRRNRVTPTSPAPRADWNAETGEMRTVRFRDPDGHRLVLVQFPADKGAGRWRRPSDRVFLGIDHGAVP
jgi:catechol 2,3-dioxygenase-like lactoylglutathione lyase family enzyme